MSKIRAAYCLAAAAGLIAPAAASAQATLDHEEFNVYTSGAWYTAGWVYQGGNSDSNYVSWMGQDMSDSRASSYSDQSGFSYTASAGNISKFNPSSPGIGNQFSQVRFDMRADASLTTAAPNAYYEYGQGGAYDYIYFTIGTSQNWSFEADVAGQSAPGSNSNANYTFFIYDTGWITQYVYDSRSSYSGGSNYNEHISLGGTLPAGSYIALVQNVADVSNGYWNSFQNGSASSTLSNGVFSIPTPGAAALLGLGGLAAARRRR